MQNSAGMKTTRLDRAAVKGGIAVAFISMSGAALLNSAAWLLFGGEGSAGKAGFALALTASVLAGVITGFIGRKRSHETELIECYANAIAKGEVATALSKDEITHPLHEPLNLIAEAQLRRIEEFHRLLEDSRIREERLYEALDGLTDEIAIYDSSGMLVSVNKAFNRHCNTAGVTVGPGMMRRDILKAMSVAPINEVPLDERDMWIDHQFQMRELATSRKGPVDSIQRDGRHLRFTLIETPSKSQIEITTDITDNVVLLQDAENERRQAEAASERKNIILGRLRDNISTPMTGVLAAAELLNTTELDNDQRGKLDVIRRSSGALLGVVQEMIELEQMQAEEDTTARIDDEEIHSIAAHPAQAEIGLNANELVDVKARAKRRAVLIIRSEELLGRLSSLLQQDNVQTIVLETVDLVISLISDVGEDAVRTDFVMSDDPDALITLAAWAETVLPANRPTVIDLNKVMTDGYRPAAETSLRKTGLAKVTAIESLAVAEQRNSIDPFPAQPLPRHPNSTMEEYVVDEFFEPKRNQLPLDVMIVEDNDVNQIVYDQLLSKCGYQYLIVSSGEEGINTAAREKPRLILMDISMPGLNGLEATRRLRASSQSRRPVIIGMTSHLLSGDREKCLASGMDDYALKPTSSGPLRAQLANWMGLGERAEMASA
jgi:CheY-like chemotaxis protein